MASESDDNEVDVKIELPPDRPQIALELKDGSEVLLSPLGADDRELIRQGFGHLSIESRYTRFGQGRSALINAELDYLADIDQRRHVAWGAAVEGEAAGVGRYIQIPGTSAAEVAVTVVDELQGRGLGKILLIALIAVARADNIAELQFEVIPENRVVQSMLEEMNMTVDLVDGLFQDRISVVDLPVSAHESALVTVLEDFRTSL